MEKGPSEYYHLPENHDQQVRSFMRWLVIGIATFLVAIISVIWFADRLLIHIPFSAEARFVKPYERLLEEYDGLDVEGKQVEQYLQSLVDELAKKSGFEEPVKLKVHLLEQPEMNAFATLGGNIFVLRGLVDSMPNENALAMVLAHEVAHIKHRDPIVSVSRGMALQVVYSFFAGDPGTIFNTGSELGMLIFSREQERRADLSALVTLQRHYGHVAGATTFFSHIKDEALKDEGAEDLPDWLLSHPKLQDRIDAINAYIKSEHWIEGGVEPLRVDFNSERGGVNYIN